MLPEAGEALADAGRRGRLRSGFPALRHRNFRLFVVGQGISLIGFWMQSVAQGWLVFRLSGSPLALGVVAFAAYLPILCLAPFAGVIADRLPRHRLLLVTQTLLMLLALGLAVLVATEQATVGLIVLFALGNGLVSALDVPARQSFLVEMVGADDLASAIALNSSIFNGARVVGPAVAGSLVGAVGEMPCFFLNAASYLAVLSALVRMRVPRASRPPASAFAAGFLSGVRYVWRTPVLRNLLLLLGVVCGLGIQYAVLMPVFARSVFGAGAEAYGLLLAAGGVGALAAALQLAWRRYSRLEHRRHLLIGLTTFAIAVLCLGQSRRLGVALVCQTLAGWGMVRYLATTNTLLQLYVDEAYRGRMMGLHTVMFLGTQPLGSLVLGAVAERVGAPGATLVSGGAALGAAGWLAWRLRRLARRERESSARA
jgi:predicted MFS family arabinose efflux permease